MGRPHKEAFDKIKKYLSKPPILIPPIQGYPLKLYLSAANELIGCLWHKTILKA